jgi:hypothetical protein
MFKFNLIYMEVKPAGRFVKKGTPSYFGTAENYVGVR